MAAFTITLPPATQAEIDGLIADLRLAVQKYSTLADKVSTTAAAIQTEIPVAQTSIQEIADAVKELGDAAKTFKFSGPLGMHGGSA
jgi:HAMP domain-containing protein